MIGQPLDLQLLNTCAALLLLLSFAMLSQRRVVTLVNLLALQGALVCIATLLVAHRTGHTHLYASAALTFGLKVIFLPWLLHRLIRRLEVYWDTEALINPTGTCWSRSWSWCSPSAWRSRFPRWRAPPRVTRSASPSPSSCSRF